MKIPLIIESTNKTETNLQKDLIQGPAAFIRMPNQQATEIVDYVTHKEMCPIDLHLKMSKKQQAQPHV